MSAADGDGRGNPRRWFFIGAAMLAASIAAYMLMSMNRSLPVAEAPPAQLPLVRTQHLAVASGRIEIAGTGFVRARTGITLTARVAGEVTYVSPQLVSGGRFDSGDVLLRLDPRVYEAALTQSRAARQVTEASLAYTLRQIERTGRLVQQNNLAEDELDRLMSQRDQQLATIEQQAAQIDRAALDLEYTTITAPFTGSVFSEQVDFGEYLSPGRELARIFANDTVEIAVELSDDDASLIPALWSTPGAAAPGNCEVTTDFGGSRFAWPCSVHRTEAAIDAESRTVNVVVRVAEPTQPGRRVSDGERHSASLVEAPPLLINSFVEVTIAGARFERIAQVPRNALHDGDNLYAVDASDRVRSLPVRVLQSRDDRHTVTGDDLVDGLEIVVSDLLIMTEGMQVRRAGAIETAP